MSKSLGNLVLVSSAASDGVDPRAIRLALLAHHYRRTGTGSTVILTRLQARLDRWPAAVRRGGPDAAATVDAVRRAMADDLDAPAALAAVDAWCAATRAGRRRVGRRLVGRDRGARWASRSADLAGGFGRTGWRFGRPRASRHVVSVSATDPDCLVEVRPFVARRREVTLELPAMASPRRLGRSAVSRSSSSERT